MSRARPAVALAHGRDWNAIGRWSARAFATLQTVVVLVALWSPPPPPPEIPIPWLDKAVHAGLFWIWAVAWAVAGVRPRLVAIIGVLLGVVTELVQGLLPWPRNPDIFDVVADAAGVVIALLLATLIARTKRAMGWGSWRNGRDSNPR